MGTLYVVGEPAGAPDDMTFRALRVLGQVRVVVANDAPRARQVLDHHHIGTPIMQTDDLHACLGALSEGDVALLSEATRLGVAGPARDLIRAAVERGLPLVPVPGAALPITALVLSGMPAASFVYLDVLPGEAAARRRLLDSVRSVRRTLVILEVGRKARDLTAGLAGTLGDRPLVMVRTGGEGMEEFWRGTLQEAAGCLPPAFEGDGGMAVLVVGGAVGPATRWDVGLLQAEILARLSSGQRAREVSEQLAAESGWPRREVYRLAVKLAGRPAAES